MAIYTGTSSNNTKNEKQYRRHFVACYYFKGCYVLSIPGNECKTNERLRPYINTEGVGNKGQITIGGPSKNQLWALHFSKSF